MSASVAGQIAENGFHSLLLLGASDSLSAEDAALNLQHKGRDWIGWTFGKPEKPKRYWLGGGGFADIEEDILVGIGIQFQPLESGNGDSPPFRLSPAHVCCRA
jgi:hypothetical protein